MLHCSCHVTTTSIWTTKKFGRDRENDIFTRKLIKLDINYWRHTFFKGYYSILTVITRVIRTSIFSEWFWFAYPSFKKLGKSCSKFDFQEIPFPSIIYKSNNWRREKSWNNVHLVKIKTRVKMKSASNKRLKTIHSEKKILTVTFNRLL